MHLVFRTAFFLSVLFALSSLVPSASFGQAGLGLANGVCRDDVNRFCADAKGKRGEVPKCLRAKVDELDSDCRQELEDRDARLAERIAIAESACPTELQKFCTDEPDYNKVPCLRKHEAELSEGCRAVMPAPKTE